MMMVGMLLSMRLGLLLLLVERRRRRRWRRVLAATDVRRTERSEPIVVFGAQQTLRFGQSQLLLVQPILDEEDLRHGAGCC